ncbi:MAG: hypothetical protein RIC55_05360 [Pirellulaceae bacterium]
MKSFALATMAFGVGMLLLVGMGVSAEDKEAESPSVKKLMQAAHKGEKSPLSLIKTEVKKEAPDWELILTKSNALAELADAIKDNVNYTSRPGPYVKSVKTLRESAEKQDAAAARVAVSGLMKSCAGCHRD